MSGQLPDGESGGLPDSIRRLADIYATADGLADDLQAKVNRLVIRGIRPIFLAVIAFAAYAHLAVEGPARYWFLIAFLGLLAISYTIYLGSHPRSRDFITRALPKASPPGRADAPRGTTTRTATRTSARSPRGSGSSSSGGSRGCPTSSPTTT